MQLHQIKPKHKKKPKRVGRGGKRGTYSGRGMKGQKSRAGRRFQPMIRELIKRYPKLRGYRFRKQELKKPLIINLDILEKSFKESEKISPQILLEKKLIRRMKGRIPKVKILAKGDIKKKLVVEGCLISKQAKEKIEKAGGIIEMKNAK